MTEFLYITILILLITVLIIYLYSKKTHRKLSNKLSEQLDENDKLLNRLNNLNENLKIKNTELQKYDGISSIKEEIESQNNKLLELNRKANNLNDRYKVAKSTYKELEKEIKLYQNDLEYIELGIYEQFLIMKHQNNIKKNYLQ
jgi:chromosome segregation ATPase